MAHAGEQRAWHQQLGVVAMRAVILCTAVVLASAGVGLALLTGPSARMQATARGRIPTRATHVTSVCCAGHGVRGMALLIPAGDTVKVGRDGVVHTLYAYRRLRDEARRIAGRLARQRLDATPSPRADGRSAPQRGGHAQRQ